MEEMHADRSAVNDKGKYAAQSTYPPSRRIGAARGMAGGLEEKGASPSSTIAVAA